MGVIELILAILGSSAFSAVITALLSKRKYKAEANKIESDADIALGKAAMDFAKMVQESLQLELRHLKDENESLKQQMSALSDENLNLRNKVAHLEQELSHYKRIE